MKGYEFNKGINVMVMQTPVVLLQVSKIPSDFKKYIKQT